MNAPVLNARDAALEALAAGCYDPKLPYHNFDHVQETLTAAEKIVERCRAESIRIDDTVVYCALLFHDAGYHEDHADLGFASKEAYSAHIAGEALPGFGISRDRVRKIVAAIMATERHANCISADQKVVRAADLSGLAAPYPEFLDKSLRLKHEQEYLSGEPMSWKAWQAGSREVLAVYLAQEIRLTSYFYNEHGESAFHAAVRENLRRLLAETQEPQAAAG